MFPFTVAHILFSQHTERQSHKCFHVLALFINKTFLFPLYPCFAVSISILSSRREVYSKRCKKRKKKKEKEKKLKHRTLIDYYVDIKNKENEVENKFFPIIGKIVPTLHWLMNMFTI